MRIFYTCKQAHQKLSENLDRELSLAERTQLKIHLSMCRSCTNFGTQMRTIRMAMQEMAKGKSSDRDEP
ncbi:zf-HC2 domain-containing protein [Undibacterium flavidum]|uniref:Zf-HC2 domain-containing protein n=1 Tax=Undibacterium flavidum TaxID=2762297 RepID=A0ABR6Y8S7_9BURK|nr:zf-HC2 domain-containing protein [Undibacterium flavidum]MBC3873026.1 zf-HC2 domain-containing protein [Undibacterium flavidum]